MRTWIKRVVFISTIAIIVSVYLAARPANVQNPNDATQPKEILGEQHQDGGGEVNLESYLVKKGDTLFNVSQKYGLSWQTLARINNLEEPYLLKIGQKLIIPSQSN